MDMKYLMLGDIGEGTALVKAADIPLHGQAHKVVVDISIRSTGRIRVFLDGCLFGEDLSKDDQLLNSWFSDSMNLAYGMEGATPYGEINQLWPGYQESLLSDLKIFSGG